MQGCQLTGLPNHTGLAATWSRGVASPGATSAHPAPYSRLARSFGSYPLSRLIAVRTPSLINVLVFRGTLRLMERLNETR